MEEEWPGSEACTPAGSCSSAATWPALRGTTLEATRGTPFDAERITGDWCAVGLSSWACTPAAAWPTVQDDHKAPPYKQH